MENLLQEELLEAKRYVESVLDIDLEDLKQAMKNNPDDVIQIFAGGFMMLDKMLDDKIKEIEAKK